MVTGAPSPGTPFKNGIVKNGRNVTVVLMLTNQKFNVWLPPTGCQGTGVYEMLVCGLGKDGTKPPIRLAFH